MSDQTTTLASVTLVATPRGGCACEHFGMKLECKVQKFKRLYGISDMNLRSQLTTIQKICPKAIRHFAYKTVFTKLTPTFSFSITHANVRISNSSAMLSPNLASLECMAQAQEIIDKIFQKMQKKFYSLKLVALYQRVR